MCVYIILIGLVFVEKQQGRIAWTEGGGAVGGEGSFDRVTTVTQAEILQKIRHHYLKIPGVAFPSLHRLQHAG